MSSGAGRYSFSIEKNADFQRTITYLVAGLPYDFTSHTGNMEIRSAPGGTLYTTFSTANGRMALGGVNGTVTLTMNAATTNTLNWSGRAFYDIIITGPSVKFRLLEGRVALNFPVTA